VPVPVDRLKAVYRAGSPAPEGDAMKIKMLETRDGSPDGIEIYTYEVGEEHTVPARLGRIFVGEGWAEKLTSDDEDDDVELEPADAELLEDMASLSNDELVAKVLELDPEANEADVVAAVAANRDGVIDAAKELLVKSQGAAPEDKNAGAPAETKKKPPKRGVRRRRS
jgi:hypothetical protein